MASWKSSSSPVAPEHEKLCLKSKMISNLIVIENVKGAIVSLKFLEDAHGLFAKPTFWLLRITLQVKVSNE